MRNGAWPEIDLAPQVLVNCVHGGQSNGCSGGSPTAAYEWIYNNGLPDETCQNYQAKDNTCIDINICRNCDPSKGCWAMDNSTYVTYHISEYGQVQGEEKMMAEIAARGPIACGLCVTPDFETYKGGIVNDTTGCKEQDHEISIAGYGQDADGTKYWIGRNSWGTYWERTAGSESSGASTTSELRTPATGPSQLLWDSKNSMELCHVGCIFLSF